MLGGDRDRRALVEPQAAGTELDRAQRRGEQGGQHDRQLVGARSPRAGTVRNIAAEPVAAADYGPLGLFSGGWAGDDPEHRP